MRRAPAAMGRMQRAGLSGTRRTGRPRNPTWNPSSMAHQAAITSTSSSAASMLRAAKRIHLLATGPDGRGAKKGAVAYPNCGG